MSKPQFEGYVKQRLLDAGFTQEDLDRMGWKEEASQT
jgi:hypothetical protein